MRASESVIREALADMFSLLSYKVRNGPMPERGYDRDSMGRFK